MAHKITAESQITGVREQLKVRRDQPLDVIERADVTLGKQVRKPPGYIVTELSIELNLGMQLRCILGGDNQSVQEGRAKAANST